MAGGASTPIVSEAEIQAALAEAQAHATSIPSLDDGQSPTVVPVPVETAAPLRPLPREAPPEAAAPAPGATPEPAAAPAPGSTPPDPAGAQAAGPPADPTAEPAGAGPRWWRVAGRILDLLYNFVDGVLWALNRPFEKLSAETRQLLGWLALATVVVSLAAAYWLPRLWPHRDAVSQLTRQSAALQQTLAAPPAADAP
ncbi:MAG: hypothetical protein AB1601_02950 [Planctomycetota bacterium]